jgi:hypothetical protein
MRGGGGRGVGRGGVWTVNARRRSAAPPPRVAVSGAPSRCAPLCATVCRCVLPFAAVCVCVAVFCVPLCAAVPRCALPFATVCRCAPAVHRAALCVTGQPGSSGRVPGAGRWAGAGRHGGRRVSGEPHRPRRASGERACLLTGSRWAGLLKRTSGVLVGMVVDPAGYRGGGAAPAAIAALGWSVRRSCARARLCFTCLGSGGGGVIRTHADRGPVRLRGVRTAVARM